MNNHLIARLLSSDFASKSIKSLGIRTSGIFFGFLTSIFLGRTLGAHGVGVINLCNTVATIMVTLSLFGLQHLIIKNVAIGKKEGENSIVQNTMLTALLFNEALCLLFIISIVVFIDFWSVNIFNDSSLQFPLLLTAIFTTIQVASRIFALGLNGLEKVWQSNLADKSLSTLVVFFSISITYIFKITPITTDLVIIFYALSRLIVLASLFSIWKKSFTLNFRPPYFFQKPLIKAALPLLFVSITSMLATNIDTFMLGILSDVESVGHYSIAARIALLSVIILQVTNSIIAPKLAIMLKNNEGKVAEKLIKKVTRVLFIVSLTFVIFLFFFGSNILQLWGSTFSKAYNCLIILALGQFINLSTGCVGILLTMSGQERIYGVISVIFLLFNILLNYFLIQKFGINGAAIATATAIILENLTKVYVAKIRTGILVSPF